MKVSHIKVNEEGLNRFFRTAGSADYANHLGVGGTKH